jgi:phosphoribosyl 1,2-cyclic phosphate phosphodiesterase
MFCKCRICENARQKGGKEMRSRAGVLVNDDLMIDFSPDAYWHARTYGLDFTKVKSIVVTHAHSDHFCADGLTNNRNHAIQELEEELKNPSPLKLFATEVVLQEAESWCRSNATQGSIAYNEIEEWKTFETDGYKITPMPTLHMKNSVAYLIEKDGKNYLHLCDSGEVKEEVFAYLKDRGVKIDVATIDATYGFLQVEYFGHLNLNQVVRICARFKENGTFDNTTQVYLTHIGHSGKCTHEELETAALKYGINVAYDGLNIEL